MEKPNVENLNTGAETVYSYFENEVNRQKKYLADIRLDIEYGKKILAGAEASIKESDMPGQVAIEKMKKAIFNLEINERQILEVLKDLKVTDEKLSKNLDSLDLGREQ